MRTLTKIFNYAAVPLYVLGEGLQKLDHYGFSVYEHMPFGGQEIRYYFSGFFGAASLAYLSNDLMPQKLAGARNELSAAFSMAALTCWELTHINNKFDWVDMGVYAAAVAVTYSLNRNWGVGRPSADPT